MSYLQFSDIIQRRTATLKTWQAAIDGNPNDPESALKAAILHTVIDPKDMGQLENLCASIVKLVRDAACYREKAARIEDAREYLMQMPCDTPYLSDALIALGYDENGLLPADR